MKTLTLILCLIASPVWTMNPECFTRARITKNVEYAIFQSALEAKDFAERKDGQLFKEQGTDDTWVVSYEVVMAESDLGECE